MFNKFVVKPIIHLCGIYLACYMQLCRC